MLSFISEGDVYVGYDVKAQATRQLITSQKVTPLPFLLFNLLILLAGGVFSPFCCSWFSIRMIKLL